MIKSKYIFDVLDKMVEEWPEYTALFKLQLPHLTESDFKYTGVGVFVDFSADDIIGQYRIKEEERTMSGLLEIRSSELKYGAGPIIYIKNGIIDCLEIFCYADSYPKRDLMEYKLIQTWVDKGFEPNIIDNRESWSRKLFKNPYRVFLMLLALILIAIVVGIFIDFVTHICA